MKKQKVFLFTDDCHDRFQLGNKGANLVTMTDLGVPVPPGFTISINAFHDYSKSGMLPLAQIRSSIRWLEQRTRTKFGDDLQVSVRSSGPVSMPGMMDTILNVSHESALLSSVAQVFDSWNSPRAVEYRRLHDIPGDLGTAVIVQAMVFGNLDEGSGTGVLFTRNPNTGENVLFGEYLAGAQGEDIVAGTATPDELSALEAELPEVYRELHRWVKQLERHYGDMQDVEFTVERNQLFILQTRTGKRTGHAAIRIAVEMVDEGLITKSDALLRITTEDIEATLYNRLAESNRAKPFATGLAAAPGAAAGQAVFTSEGAVALAVESPVILIRPETAPDDIRGIAAAAGVLTCRGGYSSHAAIVTRAMGKPCITGVEDAVVDAEQGLFRIGETEIRHGDPVTIDGTSGSVFLGELALERGRASLGLETLLKWADQSSRMEVWANADTPEMITMAREFGARGIGLLRTERMFNQPDSLEAIRRFILADTDSDQSAALAALHEIQTNDFVSVFEALGGLPVIVRLLDMPLHEFLPEELGRDNPKIAARRIEMAEVNPMMGHRGVRLGISHPELYRMQVDAIRQAQQVIAADVRLMIPQVMSQREAIKVMSHIDHAGLRVGVMIETVRACMRADVLADHTDFFSFGTNDLTQAVFSFSREDAENKFLNTYLAEGLLEHNPFTILDEHGVARLMEMAIQSARERKPDFNIGICGEHGGNPLSIHIADGLSATYVSCSPFRILIARLAAAQAALRNAQR